MAEQTCPRCGGSGWKVIEREGVSGAEKCDCLSGARAKRIEESANIPPLYRDASFDSFRLPDDNPLARSDLSHVMNLVRTYAQEYPVPNKKGLLLIGESGTGKTHLAVAALRRIISKGYEGLFYDYQNLLDRIRAGFDPNSGSSDREAYRFAMESEVLLLDDLGAHRVLDWIEDTVTSIITYRCNHGKALIATTNLPDPDAGRPIGKKSADGTIEYRRTLADHIGPRARSRLFEMCKVVRMPLVEDYRLRKSYSH